MIERSIIHDLEQWRNDPWRKPLILRGARQVGKTTIVNEFGKGFANYLYFNLEDANHRRAFEADDSLDDKVSYLFALQRQSRQSGDTLIFIDEIQNSPATVSLLRYFYEQRGDLHVIAAGSLLENVVDVNESFPVGRVQYMAVRPCSFTEFARALGLAQQLALLATRPNASAVLHRDLMSAFNQYTLVGGMPEAVQRYIDNRDIASLQSTYDSLLQTYRDDAEKYVRKSKLTDVVRYILNYGWSAAGDTITLSDFLGSGYPAHAVKSAMMTLEKAMLLELVYPSTSALAPYIPELKRKPKLIWLDTGLVGYAARAQQEFIVSRDLMSTWRGKLAEHIVAQELLTLSNRVDDRRGYWMRARGGNSAEVDFVLQHKSLLVPIEVKAGHNSHLRSLHSFVDNGVTNVAVRVWPEPYSVNELISNTAGKPFKLINLPFYMLGMLHEVLEHEGF